MMVVVGDGDGEWVMVVMVGDGVVGDGGGG